MIDDANDVGLRNARFTSTPIVDFGLRHSFQKRSRDCAWQAAVGDQLQNGVGQFTDRSFVRARYGAGLLIHSFVRLRDVEADIHPILRIVDGGFAYYTQSWRRGVCSLLRLVVGEGAPGRGLPNGHSADNK